MKKLTILLTLLTLLALLAGLSGCDRADSYAQVAATTLPVYEFSCRIVEGTGITVTRLVTESVSCLHDYSLNVNQVRSAEAAEIIVLSGAGMEDFMEDVLAGKPRVDASTGIDLLCGGESHGHDDHDDHHGHSHEEDPHIWLSPANAMVMAENICRGLSEQYPRYSPRFEENLAALLEELETLQSYAREQLAELSCRELVTFHDGFSYLADAFDLTILAAVEEEAGAETSARELKELITLVESHSLPAIFVEANGSDSSARTIAAATGAEVYTLDMAMSGDSWMEAMYRNIDTIKEALG